MCSKNSELSHCKSPWLRDFFRAGFGRSMSVIDFMTMSAPWTRVNFGGANQPKGPGERSRTMIIIGADYHPAFQQIAFVDTETGELQERRLDHPEAAEKFYRELAAQGKKVRVGMEASGHARWFALLGYSHARLGERTEALRMIEELKTASKQSFVPAFLFALVYAGLED